MSKCYFCGDQSRGCPECRDKQPTWVLVHPLGEASEQLAKAPRHPIKDDRRKTVSIADASWEEQVAWLGQVKSRVAPLNPNITLELLREVNPFRTALISRTTFENQPIGKQHRTQQWIVNDRDMFKSPEATARFVVGYWKRRRVVADGTLIAPATSYPTVLASFLTNTTNVKLAADAVDSKTVDAWKNGVWTDVNLAHACGLYSDPVVDRMAEVGAKIGVYWDKRMGELIDSIEAQFDEE